MHVPASTWNKNSTTEERQKTTNSSRDTGSSASHQQCKLGWLRIDSFLLSRFFAGRLSICV